MKQIGYSINKMLAIVSLTRLLAVLEFNTETIHIFQFQLHLRYTRLLCTPYASHDYHKTAILQELTTDCGPAGGGPLAGRLQQHSWRSYSYRHKQHSATASGFSVCLLPLTTITRLQYFRNLPLTVIQELVKDFQRGVCSSTCSAHVHIVHKQHSAAAARCSVRLFTFALKLFYHKTLKKIFFYKYIEK